MGLIYKDVSLKGDKGEGKFRALWDNGSSESFVRRHLAEKEELIIGADFLQRWKIRLDTENERIIIDPKALKLKLV